jgi:hypothetical protein
MTLKIDEEALAQMEKLQPGIVESIRIREEAVLPQCHHCRSEDSARVGAGLNARTIYLAAATTRFRLIPNGPKPGEYFCNGCGKFFGSSQVPFRHAHRKALVQT